MFGAKKEERIESEEKLKQTLLQKSQISILLKSYDDIFSSFDPRPYNSRALSDDFLLEAKKAARDKEGNLQLDFLMKKSDRKLELEILIKKRLREHFRKHVLLAKEEIIKTKREGMYMAVGGVLMLIVAATIAYYMNKGFILTLLLILLEPAGWFTAWTGLDQLYYTAKAKEPEAEFYDKMVAAEIIFNSI